MARTFSIAEAASQAGMSIDALRYYERAGLMLVRGTRGVRASPLQRARCGLVGVPDQGS